MTIEEIIKFGDIVMKYRKWLKENGLVDKTESLLMFLYANNYLQEVENENSN